MAFMTFHLLGTIYNPKRGVETTKQMRNILEEYIDDTRMKKVYHQQYDLGFVPENGEHCPPMAASCGQFFMGTLR